MEIFSEAATSDAARRAAYLDLVCGSDAELRAEVESLLATQQRVERFLDGKGGHEAVAGARLLRGHVFRRPDEVARLGV